MASHQSWENLARQTTVVSVSDYNSLKVEIMMKSTIAEGHYKQ